MWVAYRGYMKYIFVATTNTVAVTADKDSYVFHSDEVVDRNGEAWCNDLLYL